MGPLVLRQPHRAAGDCHPSTDSYLTKPGWTTRLSGLNWAESYHGKLRALAGDEEVLIMVGARCLLRDDQGRILLIGAATTACGRCRPAASSWATRFGSARSARCTRRPA